MFRLVFWFFKIGVLMGINFYLGLREVFCFWIVRVLFLGFGRFGFVLFEIVFSLGTAVFFLIGSKSF